MMKNLRLTLVSLVAMLALIITGCGGASTGTGNKGIDAPKGLTEVELGEVTHSVFYAPQYVALELGFFEEEGLKVSDPINLKGADKTMTALLSDEIQIGLMGPEASIYIYNQGREDYAVNFAQLTQCDGSFLVSREPIENFAFDDLKGKEVLGGRIGGVPEMTLEYTLKSQGLDIGINDPSKEVNVRTDVSFDTMAGAFVAGEGDFVALFEPLATDMEKKGQGYIVASIGEASGAIPYTSYSASKSYIEENPEIIQSFTNAVYKGQLYVESHSAEEIATVIQPHFAESTVEDLTVVVDRYKEIGAWDTNPYFEEEALERLMDVMEEANQLEKRASFSEIVNNTFAEEAMN